LDQANFPSYLYHHPTNLAILTVPQLVSGKQHQLFCIMLCSVCRPVILSKKSPLMDEDGTVFCVHHPTAVSLYQAAIEGFHICSSVWGSLAPSQQTCLLELDTNRNPITNMLMATPQTLELQTDVFGTDSLVVCVKFDVDKIWALDEGEKEKTNMFILQPSKGIA
jgi:hypothetical protein